MRPSKNTLLLEIVRQAPKVRDIDSLNDFLDGPLKALMRYGVMICGTGFYLASGSYGHQYHSRGFPEAYFWDLTKPDGSIDSPLMRQWRENRKPGYFQAGRDDHLFPAEWVAIFNKYDLRNTIGHAMMDRGGRVGSTFIFARLEEKVGPEQAELLEQITPNLCLALSQGLPPLAEAEDFQGNAKALLSQKQREILQWVHLGKTNWEISKILGVTEDTVKYHMNQIMSKLDTKTRAQAIGRALEIGLIVTPVQSD